MPEFFGDVAVVNGKAWPNLNVAAGLYRFRIVNGSDARFYNLRLSVNQAAIIQIGTDGGLLNAPVNVGQLLLGPGERADVLIDFSRFKNGTKIVLQNNARTPFPTGPRNKRKGGLPIPELMQFTVDTTLTPFQGTVPATLRGGPGQPPAITPPTRPTAVRNLPLNEILDPATGFPLAVLLNNLHFNTTSIETPKQGTTEMWNLINTTADTHPIHLHLVQFQLLERQPFNAAAYLAAWNAWPAQPGRRRPGPPSRPLGRPVRQRRRQAARPQRAGLQGHDPRQPRRDHPHRREVPDPGPGRLRPGRDLHERGRPDTPGLRLALPHPRARGQRDDAQVPRRPVTLSGTRCRYRTTGARPCR